MSVITENYLLTDESPEPEIVMRDGLATQFDTFKVYEDLSFGDARMRPATAMHSYVDKGSMPPSHELFKGLPPTRVVIIMGESGQAVMYTKPYDVEASGRPAMRYELQHNGFNNNTYSLVSKARATNVPMVELKSDQLIIEGWAAQYHESDFDSRPSDQPDAFFREQYIKLQTAVDEGNKRKGGVRKALGRILFRD